MVGALFHAVCTHTYLVTFAQLCDLALTCRHREAESQVQKKPVAYGVEQTPIDGA